MKKSPLPRAVPSDLEKQIQSVLPTDKATKRVIAPFIRLVRKSVKPQDLEETKHFSFYIQKKPNILIRDLTTFLSDSVDLPSTIHETTEVLKLVTKAAGSTLYMMDTATNEIYQSRKTPVSDRHKIRYKIEAGTIVAAYVAYTKNFVWIDDILQDERFPEGIGYEGNKIKAVLCVPVVTPDNECYAVIELYRQLFDKPFSKIDVEITLIITAWMGTAINENSTRLALQRQQELNDYLLHITKCYFGESVVMERMILEIIKFAKVTLGAERGSFFIIDRGRDSDDLVADMFEDDAEDKDPSQYKSTKVRLGKDRGIAATVAKTGLAINVKDAYKDRVFNKETDQRSGFIARSILSTPVMGVDCTLGVLQVVNKVKGGSFTSSDEMLFKTFAVYCTLALRYTNLKKQLNNALQLNNLSLKMLQLQLQPCIHNLATYLDNTVINIPPGFSEFDWYITTKDILSIPHICIYIMIQLIQEAEINFDEAKLFVLSVQKSYRNVPYHNFEHAFHVCHCMYLILKRNIKLFTPIEIKALFIAALCHDLDNMGVTSSFLEAIDDDLIYLYDGCILENHYYYVTMLIFNNYKVFNGITEEENALLREEIKHGIMSCNYNTYLIHKTRLARIYFEKNFFWGNEEHRRYVKTIMMMSSDYADLCKPFLISKKITHNFYAELHDQGDREMEMGLCPIPIMDRGTTSIPEAQVYFLSSIVMPCLELLNAALPNTQVLYNNAKFLLNSWQDIIDVRGKKCWRQDDSIVEKPFEPM